MPTLAFCSAVAAPCRCSGTDKVWNTTPVMWTVFLCHLLHPPHNVQSAEALICRRITDKYMEVEKVQERVQQSLMEMTTWVYTWVYIWTLSLQRLQVMTPPLEAQTPSITFTLHTVSRISGFQGLNGVVINISGYKCKSWLMLCLRI